jgi:uncharacterized membrane protein (DUF4010 family)
MTALELAARLGSALGLGLLLGLERERTQHPDSQSFAGARTFALIALLAAVSFDFETRLGYEWLPIATFAAVAAIAVVSYYVTSLQGDVGATTEITALLTFVIGGLCGAGQVGLATAVAVATLLMLSVKGWTHRFAERIDAADVEAVLKFAIITVIVLPLLPNRNFGPAPLDVVNPYKIWLMVVLISGLNFASYVLVKVVGQEHGIGITGLLGGLVSSTAVTLGFSQRSRQEPGLASSLTLGILVAWTVMFFRVLVVVALIDITLARRLALGIGMLGATNLAICGWLFRRHRGEPKASVKSGSNPFELGEAVKFGLVFGAVTFVAKAAQEYLGNAGLYFAAALAGLTDVDAIVLSMASLSQGDPSMVAVAARAIVIAAMSNTLVKAGMAVSLGSPELRRSFLPAASLLVVVGVLAAFLVG